MSTERRPETGGAPPPAAPTGELQGSSPALAIACPVCAMPPGFLCRKAGGAVQGIAHKRRRDLYWSRAGKPET